MKASKEGERGRERGSARRKGERLKERKCYCISL